MRREEARQGRSRVLWPVECAMGGGKCRELCWCVHCELLLLMAKCELLRPRMERRCSRLCAAVGGAGGHDAGLCCEGREDGRGEWGAERC